MQFTSASLLPKSRLEPARERVAGTSRPGPPSPRETVGVCSQMEEQSYEPIVPVKVGKERPRDPLEGRGEQVHVSDERKHSRGSDLDTICPREPTEYPN
jgi:hypothetical protein